MFCETAVFAALLFASIAASRQTTDPNRVPKNAVLLSKVASLTLHNGRLSTSRRVAPVPQLQCVGPKDACKLYKVDTMRCTNEGADYDAENIQWSCKAALPEEFKLGSTDVVCEGYMSSADPYVLKGSCAVEYRLLLTDKGVAKYQANGKSHQTWSSASDNEEWTGSSAPLGVVFMIIFFVVLFIILRSIWSKCRRTRPRLGGGLRPNGGGGGGDDDPPPPYDGSSVDKPSPRKQNTSTSTAKASSSRSQAGTTRANEVPQQGWRPGFWTGAAAGAAGAAYATRRSQNPTSDQQAQPPSTNSWFGNSRQPQVQQQPTNSWFSNIRQPEVQQQPTNSWFSNSRHETGSGNTSSPPSDPSYSTNRYESTGFGETRRR